MSYTYNTVTFNFIYVVMENYKVENIQANCQFPSLRTVNSGVRIYKIIICLYKFLFSSAHLTDTKYTIRKNQYELTQKITTSLLKIYNEMRVYDEVLDIHFIYISASDTST